MVNSTWQHGDHVMKITRGTVTMVIAGGDMVTADHVMKITRGTGDHGDSTWGHGDHVMKITRGTGDHGK